MSATLQCKSCHCCCRCHNFSHKTIKWNLKKVTLAPTEQSIYCSSQYLYSVLGIIQNVSWKIYQKCIPLALLLLMCRFRGQEMTVGVIPEGPVVFWMHGLCEEFIEKHCSHGSVWCVMEHIDLNVYYHAQTLYLHYVYDLLPQWRFCTLSTVFGSGWV